MKTGRDWFILFSYNMVFGIGRTEPYVNIRSSQFEPFTHT